MSISSTEQLLSAELDAALANEPGQLILVRDHIAEHLDEIADLAEVWKRRRQNKQTESYVRMALINACGALAMLAEAEKRGRKP